MTAFNYEEIIVVVEYFWFSIKIATISLAKLDHNARGEPHPMGGAIMSRRGYTVDLPFLLPLKLVPPTHF